jgi:nicotinate-nucleotide adenylyltransferase
MLTGLFGGAFDPFHKEHKRLAESAWRELNLDRILIIPSVNPPHKSPPEADFADRAAIIAKECANLPYVEVSEIEKENKQGYTYLTLKMLATLYPQDKFVFIIGADSLLQFEEWERPGEIAAQCSLAVAGREGYPLPLDAMERVAQKYNTQVIPLSYTGKEISSTGLRASIELGVDTGDVLGKVTLEYIAKKGLYRKHKKLVDYVSSKLSAERLGHTQRTVLFALELNTQVKLPFDTVFIAALLHDAAKENGAHDPLSHQCEGERLAKELGIEDKSILEAIKYHATAHAGIDALGKIIYLADKLEAGRDYACAHTFRELALKDFATAFGKVLEHNIDYLIGSGIVPDANSLACLEKLRRK